MFYYYVIFARERGKGLLCPLHGGISLLMRRRRDDAGSRLMLKETSQDDGLKHGWLNHAWPKQTSLVEACLAGAGMPAGLLGDGGGKDLRIGWGQRYQKAARCLPEPRQTPRKGWPHCRICDSFEPSTSCYRQDGNAEVAACFCSTARTQWGITYMVGLVLSSFTSAASLYTLN